MEAAAIDPLRQAQMLINDNADNVNKIQNLEEDNTMNTFFYHVQVR